MPKLEHGDTAPLELRYPRLAHLWTDSHARIINYARYILSDAPQPQHGGIEDAEEDDPPDANGAQGSGEEGGLSEASGIDPNFVVNDDQEQLIQNEGEMRRDSEPSPLEASVSVPVEEEDEDIIVPDESVPSRDLNATKEGVSYGLAIGTLPFGRQDIMNVEYESLNYQQPSSRLKKQYDCRTVTTRSQMVMNGTRLGMAGAIGLFTGLTGVAISMAIEHLAPPKYELFAYVMNLMQGEKRVWVLYLYLLASSATAIGTNVLLVGIATCLGNYCPVSTGSGIPHIKAYLNGVKIPKVLHLETYFCKVLGVICSVLGGMPVGKEGPMIHSGAIVGGGVSQGKMTSFKYDTTFLKFLRNDNDKKMFVACGSAAGVAAAFGAPIGGMLFNIEEGSSDLNLPHILHWFVSAAVSLWALNFGLRTFSNKDESNGLFTFGRFTDGSFNLPSLTVFLFMGLIGGITGGLFNAINAKLTSHRMRKNLSNWRHFREACIVASIVTIAAICSMFVVTDCKKMGADGSNDAMISMYCGAGYYQATGTIWFNTPETVLTDLYHSDMNTFESLSLLVFVICYFFISCITYGLRISSGLFIPALLTGACWGRLMGYLLITFCNDFAEWGELGRFALIGSVAQLAGIVRISFSVTAIVAEATGCLPMVLPIMCTSFVAKTVGEWFNEGIYDIHNCMNGVPVLPWTPSIGTIDKTVSTIMTSKVVCFTKRVRVREVWDALHYTCFNGFPVVEYDDVDASDNPQIGYHQRYGRLIGFVLRQDLVTMLSNGWFEDSLMHNDDLCWEMLQAPYPRYPNTGSLIMHDEVKDNCFLNLKSVMGRGNMIDVGSTYREAFEEFRKKFVRHLVVLDERHEVVGIITRKDLYRYINHSNHRTEGTKKATTPVLKLPGAKRWTVVLQDALFLPREQQRMQDRLNGHSSECDGAESSEARSTATQDQSPPSEGVHDEDGVTFVC